MKMRKALLLFRLFSQLVSALDRQPNANYRMRRQTLAARLNGVVLLFAPNEAEGPNDLYGYRPDDNFYYLLAGLSRERPADRRQDGRPSLFGDSVPAAAQSFAGKMDRAEARPGKSPTPRRSPASTAWNRWTICDRNSFAFCLCAGPSCSPMFLGLRRFQTLKNRSTGCGGRMHSRCRFLFRMFGQRWLHFALIRTAERSN